MNANKINCYWAIQLDTEEIFIRKYLGLKSRKSIQSAFKNLRVKCVVFPFPCETRIEAEYKVYRLFNLDYSENGILNLDGE